MHSLVKLTAAGLILASATNCALALTKASIHKKPQQHTLTNPFAGFYANIGLGSSNTLFTQTLLTQFEPPILPINTTASLQNFRIAMRVGLGYAIPISQRFYLGLEPFIHVSDSTDAISTVYPSSSTPAGTLYSLATQETTIKLNNVDGGLDLKPSILLSRNTSLFAVIGFDLLKAKITLQTDGEFENTGSTALNADTFKQISLQGLRLGLGMMEKLNSKWAASFYYVYTGYGNKDIVASAPAGPLFVSAVHYNSKLKLATNAYMFALQYFFNRPKSILRLANDRNAKAFAGYYLSFALGTLNDLYKNNSVYLYRIITATGLASSGNNLSGTQMGKPQGQYRFSTGYGWLLSKSGYIGIDLSTNLGQRKGNAYTFMNTIALGLTTDNSTNIAITTNTANYSAKLKTGFITDDNLLIYLQGGLVDERAQLQLTQNFTDPAQLASSLTGQMLTKNKNLLGWSAGLGVQKLLPHRFALSLDYLYSDYGNLKIDHISFSPDQTASFVSHAIVRLRDQAFMVGIVKYFK